MAKEQTVPGDQARYLLRRLVFGGQLNETRILWIIRIGIILAVVLLIGYTADITFGEWYTLFIIPILLAAAGYWFNYTQSNRQQKTEEQRAQNSALQDYLNTMKDLLLDAEGPAEDTAHSQDKDREMLRKLAQARTLTMLSRLDGGRQGSVVRFLSEARLIDRENPIIRLGGTRRGELGDDRLGERHGSSHVSPAGLGELALTLAGAKLHEVDLQGMDLHGTDLSHVDLSYANLSGADLTRADLKGSILQGATLIGADLRDATLDDAILVWANLYKAILTEDSLTEEELQRLVQRSDVRTAFLGAMMPDGTRPFPASPEEEAELMKWPEHPLVRRERELGRMARLLQDQQANPF